MVGIWVGTRAGPFSGVIFGESVDQNSKVLISFLFRIVGLWMPTCVGTSACAPLLLVAAVRCA